DGRYRGRRRCADGRQPPGGERTVQEFGQFCGGLLYRLSVAARSGPPSEMAGGEYRRRTPWLATFPSGRTVVTTQRAGGDGPQSAGTPGDIFAIYRRAAASLWQRAPERGSEERALRAVRALAKEADTVAARVTLT